MVLNGPWALFVTKSHETRQIEISQLDGAALGRPGFQAYRAILQVPGVGRCRRRVLLHHTNHRRQGVRRQKVLLQDPQHVLRTAALLRVPRHTRGADLFLAKYLQVCRSFRFHPQHLGEGPGRSLLNQLLNGEVFQRQFPRANEEGQAPEGVHIHAAFWRQTPVLQVRQQLGGHPPGGPSYEPLPRVAQHAHTEVHQDRLPTTLSQQHILG
mmetsp:Transcript_37554/g.89655  ORF Transcript_37554/g.89655 Transcript_37554/m.89655 type:complete len:211 (-) Transcript_37554:1536-2168(-)